MKKLLTVENLIIIAFSLLVYTTVFFQLNQALGTEIMFGYPDSKTYLEVAHWMQGEEVSSFTHFSLERRPFLYPIIVLISTSIAGVWGLWFVQLCMYLLSSLLVVKTVKLFAPKYIAYIALFLFSLNLALIPATMYALTELSVLCLFIVLFYFVFKAIKEGVDWKKILKVLLVLVALTLIKPVFYYPTLAFIIIAGIYGWKKLGKHKGLAWKASLIVLPLVIQVGFIKTHFGSWNVSTIGTYTLDQYLYAQGYRSLHKELSLEEARTEIAKMSTTEKRTWIAANKTILLSHFTMNVKYNISTYSPFFLLPIEIKHPFFHAYMQEFNLYWFKILKRWLFLLLPLLMLIFFVKSRLEFWLVTGLSLLLVYYFFTTGISFNQGDRLVISAYASSLILLLYFACNLLEFVWRKLRRNKI